MKEYLLTVLLLTCLNVFAANPASYEIKFPIHEDCRKWVNGNSENDQIIAYTEYFLEGENKENWSELITTQYFISRYDFALKDFFENAVRELAKTFPKHKIDSTITEITPSSISCEWWIKQRSPNDQYEWVRIFKEDNHVGILRYTTKRMNQINTTGKLWQNILSKAIFLPL